MQHKKFFLTGKNSKTGKTEKIEEKLRMNEIEKAKTPPSPIPARNGFFKALII